MQKYPIVVKLAFNDVGKTVHGVMLCQYQTKSCPHGTHSLGEGPGKHPSAHEVGVKYEDRGCGHTIDWPPPQTGDLGRQPRAEHNLRDEEEWLSQGVGEACSRQKGQHVQMS